MIKKIKETSGAISLYVIMIMVFLLPFAIWVGVELPKSHELNQRVKDAVDSSSSAGVTAIASNEIKPDTEVVPLDDVAARNIATQIFASKMGLEISGNTLVAPEGSFIESAVITVDVFDEEDGLSLDSSDVLYYQTKNGKRKIEHSAVVVTATVSYDKMGVFGKDIVVTHVGMNQAKMNPQK